MAGTLATSGSVIIKAGANVSSSIANDTWDTWIEEAEAVVSTISRYDWVTNYATVETNFKPILREIVSNIAAIYAIIYDMSGYTTRIEAEDMINVLRDAALRGLSLLRDQKGVSFGK
jgi:hypothetical protein